VQAGRGRVRGQLGGGSAALLTRTLLTVPPWLQTLPTRRPAPCAQQTVGPMVHARRCPSSPSIITSSSCSNRRRLLLPLHQCSRPTPQPTLPPSLWGLAALPLLQPQRLVRGGLCLLAACAHVPAAVSRRGAGRVAAQLAPQEGRQGMQRTCPVPMWMV